MSRFVPATLLGLLLACSAHAAAPLGVELSDTLVKRYTPTIDAMGRNGWDHSNSAVLHGMEKVYRRTRNPAHLAYIKAFADQYINADGSIKSLQQNLDGMHPGVLCLFLYEETGEKKYLQAAKTMRDMMLGAPAQPSVFQRTPQGGFWHKNEAKYKNVMTVDGQYMALPFLARYALVAKEPALLDLVADQLFMLAEHSFDAKTKLAYHGWDAGKEQPWAHPITGNSSLPWSRANGWYSMALVDILEDFPTGHPHYGKLLFLYRNLAQGIKAAQHSDGYWYHVLDTPTRAGNFQESSATGMMVYALQKGVNLKLLDPEYSAVAQRGWQALQKNVTRHADGGLQVNSVAPGMGIQNDYDAYVAVRPVSVPPATGRHHAHGYISVLMAASVMER